MRRTFAILLLLGASLLLFPGPAPVVAQSDNLSVVLLIDNSGSMGGNDRAGLRWSAAQLFVDLADQGDEIAAVAFADGVTPLGDAAAGETTLIGGDASRERLKEDLAARSPAGATNMADALETALSLLEESDTRQQAVVFLTDGRPEPPGQIPELQSLIQEAGGRGVTIFPILLGADTDRRVAAQMVRDTGGLQQEVQDASGLLRAFGRIYTFIRPERYAEDLALTDFGTQFTTNRPQAITDLTVVVPRGSAGSEAIEAVTLNDERLAGALTSGAATDSAEAPHYELITVSHNAPIAGEWEIQSGGDAGNTALLIARSGITLDVIHPVSSIAGSFVAPRLVPAGEPVLLVARVLQDGSEVGEVPLSVITREAQALPLETEGLSANQTLGWRFLELALGSGEQRQMALQVGEELAPFRLRKEMVIEAADVPPLIVDSPTATDSGLQPGGGLRIAAHFAGEGVNGAEATAYVYDAATGDVTSLSLSCQGNRCEDRSFTPQPGRSYEIVLAGTARHQGRPYASSARTLLATGDVMRIDGLTELSQLAAFAPGNSPPPVPLDIIAFVREGQPELVVALSEIRPRPEGVPAGALGAVLAPLTPSGSNTYESELSLSGFNRLPPGDYSARLSFSSPDVNVTPKTVDFAFSVTQPTGRLVNLPSPLDFGQVPRLTDPQVLTVSVEYQAGEPFEIGATVRNLTSNEGAEDPELITVDVGPPLAAGGEEAVVYLRMSALRRLHPGSYRGELLFRAADADHPGKIEPETAAFEFFIPQPMLAIQEMQSAGDPVGCPELEREPASGDLLEFGAFRTTSQPKTALVQLDSVWVEGNPEVNVSLASLQRPGEEAVSRSGFLLTAGQPQPLGEGSYHLPLELQVPAGAPDGLYTGMIRFASPGTAVEPDTLRTRFHVRTSFLGRVRQQLRPAGCAVQDWYLITPFPRWKGLVGWGITGLVMLVLVNTAITSRGATGTIRSDEGAEITVSRETPVYVVRGNREYVLTHEPAERKSVVARVSISEGGDSNTPRGLVSRGMGLKPRQERVLYWNPQYSKWGRVKPQGKRLPNNGRFAIQRYRGKRYGFTILID